jgi:hypothetical protein
MGLDREDLRRTEAEASKDDPVSALCDLAQARIENFEALALNTRYGTSLSLLMELGIVGSGTPLSVVTCRACDNDHSAVVEFDPSIRHHIHFCAEAGLVVVDDAALATLRFDLEWLLDWLVRELPIALPVRRRILVPDQVWYLGGAIVGSTALTAIFARGVSSAGDLEALAEAVSRIQPEGLGLVITSSSGMPRRLLQSHNYFPLGLQEIMRPGSDRLVLEKALLGAWVKSFRRNTDRPARDGPGRPSESALVLQIYRELQDAGVLASSTTGKAREIRAGFVSHYPDRKPPAVKTIERHLRNASL